MSSLMIIFNHIYNISLFAGLIVGLLKYKNLLKPLRLVLLFVALGCFTESLIDILKHFGIRNSMPVGHIYFPLSILILGLFYILSIKDFINRKIVIGTIVIFEILSIVNLIFIQNIHQFPNIIAAIGALIIIAFSIIYFSKVMTEAKIKKLSDEPMIWINTALLIYFSANFFFYILFNLNVEFDIEFAKRIHAFFFGFNILLYALIIIAFLKVKGKNLAQL